jgi:hypothetical protein
MPTDRAEAACDLLPCREDIRADLLRARLRPTIDRDVASFTFSLTRGSRATLDVHALSVGNFLFNLT